jgi:hypothetical protein
MAQPPERESTDGNGLSCAELEKICTVIQSGHGVVVLGESITNLPEQVYQRLESSFSCAIATYKGSSKTFLKSIAEQMDIDTTEEKFDKNGEVIGERQLTLDQLKSELLKNASSRWLLVLPDAKRLTVGVRYWLEDAIARGVKVCCFTNENPRRDIFINLIEIKLELPSDAAIRIVMAAEAQRQGLKLSEAQLAALQPLAGRNPNAARKVIQNEKLGIQQPRSQHSQYLDISPLILSALCMLGVLRFIGMGTGDRALYLVGGIAMMVGLALKYLGKMGGRKAQ